MMSGGQQVNVMSLPIPELKHLAEQLQQEVEILGNSMQSLKSAQNQFVESKDCLGIMHKTEKGKEMLVPMSSCLYVPGKVNDPENVMVDIGTGYYVEKNIEDAEEFFKRKIDFLKQQMDSLQKVLQQKFQTKQVITEVLQAKLMQQQQQTQK